MDTTVSTDSISIGGMYVPSRQVHNIGKLEERRNHLIGSGFCILIGVILFVSGRKSSESQTEFTGKTRKCPACAEEIKIDANICRFCKLDFNEHNWKMALKEGNHTSCPRCLSSVQLDAQEVSSGNFECPICKKTILFSCLTKRSTRTQPLRFAVRFRVCDSSSLFRIRPAAGPVNFHR